MKAERRWYVYPCKVYIKGIEQDAFNLQLNVHYPDGKGFSESCVISPWRFFIWSETTEEALRRTQRAILQRVRRRNAQAREMTRLERLANGTT